MPKPSAQRSAQLQSVRNANHATRQREKGRKPFYAWLTPEEIAQVRAMIAKRQEGKK